MNEPIKTQYADTLKEVIENKVQKRVEMYDMHNNIFLMQFHPFEKNTALIVSVDMTEFRKVEEDLKRSEARLKSAVANAPIPIILHNQKGEVEFINDLWTELSGYTHKDIPTISSWVEKAYGGNPQIERNITELFNIHSGTYVGPFTVTTKSGEERIWDFYAAPLDEEVGSSRMVISMAVDITEKVRLEEEQRDLSNKLVRSQKLEGLGVLTGGIAHDFNNFLMGITGYISLAKMEENLPNQVVEFLEESQKIAKKASNLVSQMLAYSGRAEFNKLTQNLNTIVLDIEELLRVSISKQIELTFDLQEDLDMILADQSQLEQIILNLVTNASDALEGNEGKIIIRTYQIQLDEDSKNDVFHRSPSMTGHDYVVIEVEDNGMGIADEDLQRIFDPFYSTKAFGRGLGLSVILGIVFGHDGGIDIQTEKDEGTIFTIYLPCYKGDMIQERDEVRYNKINQIQSNKRILLLDDEETVLEILEFMLKKLGFEVVAYQLPLEAFGYYKENYKDISLVVTDFTMTQINGAEFLNRCKVINQNIKAIMISGYGEREVLLGTLHPNNMVFLQKPFDLEKLKKVIFHLIE